MPHSATPRPGLESRHMRLAACAALRTVGDAVRLGRAAGSAPEGAGWEQWVAANLAPQGATGFRYSTTLAAIRSLLEDISVEWREAAAAVLDHPERAAGLPSEETLRGQLVGRVGWRLGGSLSVKLSNLTVRLATEQETEERRARLHTAYEQDAREHHSAGPPPAEQPAAISNTEAASDAAPASCVPAILRRVWQIKWEREHKETLWRLVVYGVPLPGNTHLNHLHPEPCGCGTYGGAATPSCSPRAHHFWACPVAQAVVQQITAHVPGPITRAHVWLAETPPGMQQCVWDVVCLAALSAMERGRMGMRADTRYIPGPNENVEAGAPTPVEVAKARAVLDFWQRLRGFAELGMPKHGWDGVGPDHPILAVAGEHLQCAQPVGLGNEGEGE